MIGRDFHPEMPEALDQLNRLSAGRMPMFITDQIWLPYVDVLYYRKVDPAYFQQSGAKWSNPDFGLYRFNYQENFQSSGPFAFLLLRGESMVCNQPSQVEDVGRFLVGLCEGPGSHSLTPSPGLIPSRN